MHAHARLQGSESENGVEWYNMLVTCQTSNAVKVSEVEWYNMLVTCQTSRQ